MRNPWLVGALVVGTAVAVGCSGGGGETNPKPDPVTSSSGVGGSGTGGANAGGTGAGGDDTTIPGNQSGDRLKAQWLVGDDGSRQFFGWQDSEKGVACSASDTASGLRCVPAQGAIYFTNITCNLAVHAWPANCIDAAPAYASRAQADGGCSSLVKVYAVGNVVPQPQAFWTRDNNGSCVSTTVGAGYEFRTATATPDTDWVALTPETDP
ncbi:MAG: hypothetical protein KC731_14285 [Myxococcales bacterium]|nr:hypothetical protein [Myxococcales bacterium]